MIKKHKVLISVIALGLITFISFLSSLQNKFVNWDDDKHITDNYIIQNLSFKNIKKMFSTVYENLYQPLVFLSFSVEYYFFKLNPLYYHINNLILHILNAILVFWLFYLISDKILSSFIIAVLFGIHPLHVESVAWATERKDVLYSLFFLSSIISYIYYRKSKSSVIPTKAGTQTKYYYLSLFLFILSLFTKSMAATLPFVLLLYDYINNRKFNLIALKEKIPFFILSAIFIFITIKNAPLRQAPIMPTYYYLFTASYGFIFYIIKLIAPVNLSCFYPYPEKLSLIYWISPILLLILIYTLTLSLKHTKKGMFGALFFIITILPVVQIIPSSKTIVADRYSYVPLIGLIYIIAEGSAYKFKFQNSNFKTVVYGILSIIIITLSFLTYQRCKVWKDSITLWTDVLKNYPKVAIAYNNRGVALKSIGKSDKAFSDYNKAIELNPKYPEAYNNRGVVYNELGNYEKALEDYNKAIEVHHPYSDAYLNRANIYILKNDYNKAMANYVIALKFNPDFAKAHLNIGNILNIKKNYDKAIIAFTKVLEINPNYAEAYFSRGVAYYSKNEFEKALSDFNEFIKINPNDADALNYIGNINIFKKKYSDATNNYNKSISINTENAETYYNRGIALSSEKKYDKAIESFTEAIKINPKYVEAYNNRGIAYSAKGNNSNAIADYNKVIQIKPDYIEAYVNRAVAYNSIGNTDKAISDLNKAIKLKPDNHEVYLNRGVAYGIKNELDKAIADFTKAIELKPADAETYYNRGYAYYKKKNYKKSLEDFSKSQSLGFNIEPELLEFLQKSLKK